MLCLTDVNDLRIWGNYDSDKASNLMIVFETCDPKNLAPGVLKCKSETTIKNWME